MSYLDNDKFLIIGLREKRTSKILIWDLEKNEKFGEFKKFTDMISVFSHWDK